MFRWPDKKFVSPHFLKRLQEKLTQQTIPRGQNTTCDGCVIIPLQLGLQIVLGMGVPSNFSHAAALTATNVENAMISEVKYFMIQLIFAHYTYYTKVNGLYLKRLMLHSKILDISRKISSRVYAIIENIC